MLILCTTITYIILYCTVEYTRQQTIRILPVVGEGGARDVTIISDNNLFLTRKSLKFVFAKFYFDIRTKRVKNDEPMTEKTINISRN